jgi:nucleotide-binding universal stress UspA family protein
MLELAMFEKILVAVDGSKSSIYALDYAANIAYQVKSELAIISVPESLPPFIGESEEVSPAYVSQFHEHLYKELEIIQKEQLNRLSEVYPELRISSKVRDGRPALIIKEESIDSDLIVLGHRGRGGVISWILGSVAKEIVDSCTVPVLVVKNPDYCPL